MNPVRSISLLFVLPALLLTAAPQAIAQPTGKSVVFRVDRVEKNEPENLLEFWITAAHCADDQFFSLDDASHYKIEQLPDLSAGAWNIINIGPAPQTGAETVAAEHRAQNTAAAAPPRTILLLLDRSGSMLNEGKLEQAKNAIRKILESGSNDRFMFTYFHDEVCQGNYLLNWNLYEKLIKTMDAQKFWDTDLYCAIRIKTEELKKLEGEKILILLTDGKNDVKSYKRYAGHNHVAGLTETDLLQDMKSLDSSFQVYPIGIGRDANEQFLRQLAESTPNPYDYYQFGVLPENITSGINCVLKNLRSNLLLRVQPDAKNADFGADSRRFLLTYTHGKGAQVSDTSAAIYLADFMSKIRLSSEASERPWLSLFIGLFLVGGLLWGLVKLTPVLSLAWFRNKYVRQYGLVKRPNITSRDPLTLEPIRDEEDVVVVGDKVMLYDTWKYTLEQGEGNLSTTHSEFFVHQPKGRFFDQGGVFRRLNWLWFGTLGGFVAWMLLSVPKLKSWFWLREVLLPKYFDTAEKQISDSLYEALVQGLAVGLGIVAALSVVEELGQSRRFSIWRIIGRALSGSVAGAVIFFLSQWVVTLIDHDYLGRLAGWFLFGALMGLIVSVGSSIRLKTGLIAGMLAGLAAFHIYYLLTFLLGKFTGSAFSGMMGLIIYGGVLGYMVFAVVSRLEDFELQVLVPKEFFGQKRPISKWLKSPQFDHIHIGVNPACEVYVKWPDKAVKDWHAKLSYGKGVVFIEPNEGEVLVNGQQVRKKTPLQHLDRIQLGAFSNSILQFLAKEKDKKKDMTGEEYPGRSIRVSSTGAKGGSNPEVRSKIRIKPRS